MLLHNTSLYTVTSVLKVVSFAGGNAGMATVYAARKMGVPATIIVPSSTPQLVVQRLKDEGAAVKIVGKVLLTNMDV